MPLSESEDLLLRKRAVIGGGARVPKRKGMRTSPERKFIYKQRDKVRARTRRVM